MSSESWRTELILALAVGLMAALALVSCPRATRGQPVSLMGSGEQPVPIGMSGIAETGVLTSSAHELEDGYFALGQGLSVVVKPGTPFYVWLSAHRDEQITLRASTECVCR